MQSENSARYLFRGIRVIRAQLRRLTTELHINKIALSIDDVVGIGRAAADGLCDEGALEVALEAIRSLDINQIVRELKTSSGSED